MSWIDALIFGYRTVQAAGVPLPLRSVLNLVAGGSLADNAGLQRTDMTVGGGGSSVTSSLLSAPTTGTMTLVAAQLATPVLVLSLTLTGNLVVAFADAVGSWVVDTNAVTLAGHTLTFSAGAGTFAASAGQLYVVVTEGGGVIRVK